MWWDLETTEMSVLQKLRQKVLGVWKGVSVVGHERRKLTVLVVEEKQCFGTLVIGAFLNGLEEKRGPDNSLGGWRRERS